MKEVLKFKEFRRLWLGQTVSQFGDAVYALLFIFMADKITQRPDLVGLVGAATAAPFLIFSPLAGVIADRVDRRKIMLACDILSACLLAGFAVVLVSTGTPPVWTLFVTPFLLSTVNSLFLPAKGAAVPSLVPAEHLLAANSLSSATTNLMHTVGLLIAGLLLAPLEAVAPKNFFLLAVIVNLVTFLVSAGYVSGLPPLPPQVADEGQGHVMQDLKDGVVQFASQPVLRVMAASNLVTNLAVSGFMVVYTTTNRAWFDGSFRTLALVEFSFLVSLVVGSLLVPKFTIRRVGLFYSIGLAVVGLDVVALGWARTVPLYVAGNIVAGLILPFVNVPFMTYLNLVVPPEFRGRINAVLTMFSAGVHPVGNALAGAGLRSFGLVGMYVLMGGMCAISALAPLMSKTFRNERMPAQEAA